jgi:hypothetical protein
VSFLFCEKERLSQSVLKSFVFFSFPFFNLKNLGFVKMCPFLFSRSFDFFFHTPRISQIAFHLFLLALKVCLQNLFCCAVVGRGEREEKTLGKKEL